MSESFEARLFRRLGELGFKGNDAHFKQQLDLVNKRLLNAYVVGKGKSEAKCKLLLEYFSKHHKKLYPDWDGPLIASSFSQHINTDKIFSDLTLKPSEQIQALFLAVHLKTDIGNPNMSSPEFEKFLKKAKGACRAKQSREVNKKYQKKTTRNATLKLSSETAEALKLLRKNYSDDEIISAAIEKFDSVHYINMPKVNEYELTEMLIAARQTQQTIRDDVKLLIDRLAALDVSSIENDSQQLADKTSLSGRLKQNRIEMGVLISKSKALRGEMKKVEDAVKAELKLSQPNG